MSTTEVLQNELSQHVWQVKYRDEGENDIRDTWRRVADTVASVEDAERAIWEERFFSLLSSFRFLPGGRILAGAGTNRRVTLFNCFVMGVIDDSMEGIFDGLKEGALTMQRGGGVGYDFSTLRPAGTVARATGSIASGPVSFMHIWDAMCATMLSTGSRRGAMMASLRCDHPDIEQFIDAKRDPKVLRHFNLSVQVTDAFMEAVGNDRQWPLVFPEGNLVKETSAKDLWQKIIHAAYDSAEPGVLFVDHINRENNLGYLEKITTTNPCGEVPLPPYGVCNLGSLNLPAFVAAPFGQQAALDFEALADSAALAIRFLDNVVDISDCPLAAQTKQAQSSRRVGLGITGLADALAMLGLRYDSDRGREVATDVMRTICYAAYRASMQLAEEKGAFPDFNPDGFLGSGFMQRMPSAERDAIARNGIRNSHLLAIAPAGTISLLANNVSSGIEPIFAFEGTRRVLDRNGSYRTFPVRDFAWDLWCQQNPSESLPAAFIEAPAIAPKAHLEMQAALQPFVDGAISKTVNVAEDYPYEDFAGLYSLAYRAGLKGCTVYRQNSRRGEVLMSDCSLRAEHPVDG